MTYLSDTLTVGLVLILLFGSIALYLYTRIQQAEQKISLLESILLDLKMSAEIKTYTELPADEVINSKPSSYTPYHEEEHTLDNVIIEQSKQDQVQDHLSEDEPFVPSISILMPVSEETQNDVEQYKTVVAEAINESLSYDSMSLKELQSLAKSRGILASSMKKMSIIEALKTSDRSQNVKPGSSGMSSSSFLETSEPFSDDLE